MGFVKPGFHGNNTALDLREYDGFGRQIRVYRDGVQTLYRYDAFGNQYKPDATGDPHELDADPNPFRYCGEYFDRETGEVYLRARYYSPTTGRFLMEDTVRFIESKLPNGQKIVDPLSLNLYTYCYHNPIMYIDPSGNSGQWFDLGKGWRYRIEPAHVDNGKGDHIHIQYKEGKKCSHKMMMVRPMMITIILRARRPKRSLNA